MQDINALLSDMTRDKVEDLEAEMLQYDQVEIPVEHRYINGMYVRKIIIPAGTILTGRVHKYPYVDIMLSGDITVATPDGIKRMTGFQILNGQPGRKRAGCAHEDTHWVTVHKVREEDANENFMNNMTFFSLKEYEDWLANNGSHNEKLS